MKDGSCFEEFASECNVAISTIYLWAKEHKEFSEAKKIAEGHSLKWWMNKGRTNIAGQPYFRDAVYIFNLKCRFAKYGFNPDASMNSFWADDDEETGIEFTHKPGKAG